MSNKPCPLTRIIKSGSVLALANMSDVQALSEVATSRRGSPKVVGRSDDSLFYLTNHVLCGSAWTATCIDQHNQLWHDEQERFKAAYATFQRAIASISTPVLRSTIELPTEYTTKVESSFLLSYATRPAGKIADWRRDEFYIRLLALYSLYAGEQPAKTEGGPSVRFLQSIGEILRHVLNISDRSSEHFDAINKLWTVPRTDTFLHDWYKSRGGKHMIQPRIDEAAQHLEAAYLQHLGPAARQDNVIFASFGGGSLSN